MLETIQTFFALYWHIVLPIVLLTFLAIPIITNWYEVRYALMKARINTPWVGRLAHWVKNPGSKEQPTPKNPEAVGFYESENQLNLKYETYYRDHQPSEAHFKRCQDYLRKIGEDNRKEKGFGMWAIIIVLMLIEATAFGYALAPFALTLATPDTAVAGAFGIGLVISIIGVFLSEFAGRQLYLNSIVGKIMGYEELRHGGADGDMVSRDIVTIDNTNIDDGRPEYQRMLNRVKVPQDGAMPAKRYGIVIGYAVFIVILAVAAFWVRTETLNAQEADLIANPPAVSQAADDFPASGEDDFPLPGDMQSIANDTAGKSAQDQIDALHRASLVTFAVLSALFIFIQFTSTFLAYTFGFAGTYSRKAWELVHKFSSASEFTRYHEAKARSIANDAQSALGKLQALQLAQFRVKGGDREELRKDNVRRTFIRFIEEQDAGKAWTDQKAIAEQLGKDSRAVLENYIKKSTADLNTAIANNDSARIDEIIRVALPRMNQIDDPSLFQLRDTFRSVAKTFVAPAAPAPAPTVAVQVNVPVETQPVVAVVHAAPVVETAPAVAAPVVQAAPASVAAAPVAAPAAGGFDPNQFGDLTEFHDDDLSFVATTKGVDLDTIKRARRLQLMVKQSTQRA
ncbi:hypothetical protein [Pseudomonas kurunegalensis]|uniref:hypothetical protein n=1 Tax=Pseudomonas kurunegalensis TaxID=485880 RepID=UPI002895F621|nr:hypothetical protein [Pseudomonas kurunegalensis]MDT3748077.1 hypothetical protein [Pseudomonas kurunegalensis]